MHKIYLKKIRKHKFKITTKLDVKASRCQVLISNDCASYKSNFDKCY